MKVLVAMSGGVDSSVAAAELIDAGHEVVGVTMRLWGGSSDTGCCSVADVDDARRVAQQLGIDHVVFNFSDDFNAAVVAPYVEAHRNGTTPNPCIECNRHLKFARLSERADALDFDAIATGHHARIERLTTGTGDEPRWLLRRGADEAEDQSYVVHMLDQRELARTLFPVGGMSKDQVRAIAARRGLRTASKPDSQDVCFIGRTEGRDVFLGSRIPFRSGRVVNTDGEQVGEVPAVELVTLGQRRGLGLPGGGPKRYVVAVDHNTATVVVGDEELLDVSVTEVSQVVWADPRLRPALGETLDVMVQCSAHGAARAASLRTAPGPRLTLHWSSPQRRIAPGQSVVFYDPSNTYVFGGGIAI